METPEPQYRSSAGDRRRAPKFCEHGCRSGRSRFSAPLPPPRGRIAAGAGHPGPGRDRTVPGREVAGDKPPATVSAMSLGVNALTARRPYGGTPVILFGGAATSVIVLHLATNRQPRFPHRRALLPRLRPPSGVRIRGLSTGRPAPCPAGDRPARYRSLEPSAAPDAAGRPHGRERPMSAGLAGRSGCRHLRCSWRSRRLTCSARTGCSRR